MNTATLIWLIILSVALIAHMIKDGIEFKKIKQLQEEVNRLKGGRGK